VAAPLCQAPVPTASASHSHLPGSNATALPWLAPAGGVCLALAGQLPTAIAGSAFASSCLVAACAGTAGLAPAALAAASPCVSVVDSAIAAPIVARRQSSP
jgi:hypothetical protein